MERRKFLKNSTTLVSMFSLGHMTQHNIFSMALDIDDIAKIKVGKFDCTIFQDLQFKYQAKDFFINANVEQLNQSLDKYQISSGNIPSPFIAVLLEQDDKKILIDTGVGFSKEPVNIRGSLQVFKGRLLELLQRENLKKEEITDVIITHFHPDHIGGIFSEHANLNFPNARFHMHEDEWNYWHSSQSDSQPGQFKYFVEKNITKLKGLNMGLIKGDFVEVLPGITAVKADGHTPGQIALIIHSGKEHLLYISDAFLHPLHMERTDWQTNYDLDHAKAKQSRLKLLDLAYKDNMLVSAFHFDFPGLGRIDKFNDNWLWKYSKNK